MRLVEFYTVSGTSYVLCIRWCKTLLAQGPLAASEWMTFEKRTYLCSLKYRYGVLPYAKLPFPPSSHGASKATGLWHVTDNVSNLLESSRESSLLCELHGHRPTLASFLFALGLGHCPLLIDSVRRGLSLHYIPSYTTCTMTPYELIRQACRDGKLLSL